MMKAFHLILFYCVSGLQLFIEGESHFALTKSYSKISEWTLLFVLLSVTSSDGDQIQTAEWKVRQEGIKELPKAMNF